MNYATILGGMCTLVGTSTNLIVAGLVLRHGGIEPLEMFDPLGVGAAAAVAGGLYLLVASRWLLPERRSALQQAGDIREYVVEMRSEEHTSELQSLMRNSYAVFCLKKKNDQPSQSGTQAFKIE